MKIIEFIMLAALHILQWNAQGMFGHGQELVHFLHNTETTYQAICIQETWYDGNGILNIPHYQCLYRNRKEKSRGGCAIYIHNSMDYDAYVCDEEIELQKISLFVGGERVTLVNFYNPCKKLDEHILDTIFSYVKQRDYIIVGDFNAHNTLWGSDKK